MLKRRWLDILFSLLYIITLCIIVNTVPAPYSGEEKEVHNYVEEMAERVAEVMTEVQSDLEQIEIPEYEYLGTFITTAYCPCYSCSSDFGYQTATGVTAKEGVTIAVDPSVIPYGTVVIIDGHEYIAQDCGSEISGKDIDIFFESHSVAREYGVQEKEVYVKWAEEK